MHGIATGLAAYLILFIVKLVVFFQTDLLVMYAEALHSLADVFVAAFLLVATHVAGQPADENHAFGHGRAQFVAALVAGTTFISFTSLEGIREAVPRLVAGGTPPPTDPLLAYLVLVLSMGLSAVALAKLSWDRRKGVWGPTSKAQVMDLVNDQAALVAAMVGVFLATQGIRWADPVAAIAVSILIAINGALIFRENAIYLMGRSPDPHVLQGIARDVRAIKGVVDIHDLRAEYIAPDELYASIHVEVKRGTTVEDADLVAEEVDERLHAAWGCVISTIHMDPEGEKGRGASVLGRRERPAR